MNTGAHENGGSTRGLRGGLYQVAYLLSYKVRLVELHGGLYEVAYLLS